MAKRITLAEALEIAKSRCSPADAGLADDLAAYESMMEENAQEIMDEMDAEADAEEAEEASLESSFAAFERIDETVSAILAGIGHAARVSGVGSSRYIHANGVTIRVSDHAAPVGRGGLDSNGVPHDEADMSLDPSTTWTVANAIEKIVENKS